MDKSVGCLFKFLDGDAGIMYTINIDTLNKIFIGGTPPHVGCKITIWEIRYEVNQIEIYYHNRNHNWSSSSVEESVMMDDTVGIYRTEIVIHLDKIPE